MCDDSVTDICLCHVVTKCLPLSHVNHEFFISSLSPFDDASPLCYEWCRAGGGQRSSGGEAAGRQVVKRLRRQLSLNLTRIRLSFCRHTSDAMLKKCRRREGGEKGRRRNSYETKGSLMLLGEQHAST